MRHFGRRPVLTFAVAGWLAAVAAGFARWERYDATPGAAAQPAASPATGGWSLAMYVHPECPCARAVLGELAEVLRAAPVPVDAAVVVVVPPGAPDDWGRGSAWAVPGAQVCRDAGGAEARRAGARTSGHVVLTDPAGRVAFRGGLTRGRGKVGESVGRRAVLAALGGEPGERQAPVYGCPLFDPGDGPESTREDTRR